MPNPRKYNAVVLGAGGVGKSALATRFHRKVFVEQYNPTIEEEYRCEVTVDGERCILEILDTPGTEQFTALNERYLRGAQAFILVFSLIEESSLKDVDNIRQQIYQLKGTDKVRLIAFPSQLGHEHDESDIAEQDIPIVVVGTKLDLSNERAVSRDTIKDLAVQWNLPFYETSAKKDWHVTDVFEDLVRQLRNRYPDAPRSRRKKKDTCCVM
ncbi:uncharacterized protein LAESUDRAFT_58316 [Laetiporus sulphureus 93-53]|uniref:Ras-domain-containing protein n=1 Tax=Laetiporus sulphureus 93-53 TaxID=1314785 RepID=A0A165AZ25_9APHY|nr:uncharacterized protein LAESUDRAFT_58316 [Laetiporus sulphureus 93-53]KZS99924.1 hypothetical protein LAESUDRAFT_58316 [Laetiporus sulphureus 93-53]